ncbi:hypothetical protein HAX54_018662, partial [Datura stramonium]|nr:hypothetical protein [Datura stramonium]
ENIHTALTKAKLAGRVKSVVSCSSDAFQSESGLPLKGHFRVDVSEMKKGKKKAVMKILLKKTFELLMTFVILEEEYRL